MTQHTITAYEEELQALDAAIVAMGELVVSQVRKAVSCIETQDAALAQTLIERDASLDQMEADMEERSVRLFALRQPLADDLRNTLSALKISINLERCGDLAKSIAKRTLASSRLEPEAPALNSVVRMGALVERRLEQVMEAYRARDNAAAAAVWRKDADIDQQYESVFRELLTYMMGDPRLITPCAHLLFVAKNLERIGDHATNIAEDIHFWLTGDSTFGAERPKWDLLTSEAEASEAG